MVTHSTLFFCQEFPSFCVNAARRCPNEFMMYAVGHGDVNPPILIRTLRNKQTKVNNQMYIGDNARQRVD